MTSEEKVWQAARFLHEAHRARAPYQPLPDGIFPRDINEAYDIQEAFHELLLPERGAIVGYKVTSGVHHSPVTINASDYVHVGAECEIAMLLEQDLPASAAPYDRESVARAVAALMPAFELVDDRGADYTDLYFLNVAADNSWNAGIVLGEAVIDWQDIDLVAATGTMTINGQPAGVGKGGDVLGHPLEALAWLANNLAERGKSLQKDMVVMTGSIVSTKFLNKGDEVHFGIDTLGDVRLTVA